MFMTESPVSNRFKTTDVRFRTRVEYVRPSRDELLNTFQEYTDSYILSARFEPIIRCMHIPLVTRDVMLEYLYFNGVGTSKKMIFTEMDQRKKRPAVWEELFAFVKQHPEEICEHEICIIGSEARIVGEIYSPLVVQGKLGRRFGIHCPNDVRILPCRYLVVPQMC